MNTHQEVILFLLCGYLALMRALNNSYKES
uniref:Uncharacterized protein n=1 Tax=Rhizophora mucronata TaxID=61149 RepID=A0A2P2KGB1_RHIMU